MDVRIKLRGQNYDRFLIQGPLTDAIIERYELLGYYGSARQTAARKRDAERRLKAELRKLSKLPSREKIMSMYG